MATARPGGLECNQPCPPPVIVMLLILALNSVVPPGIRAEFQHEYPEFQRPTANCSSG